MCSTQISPAVSILHVDASFKTPYDMPEEQHRSPPSWRERTAYRHVMHESFCMPICLQQHIIYYSLIGKYLSGLCKLDSVIVLKAGFETQLRAPRLSIPFGMSALSMTRQIGDGCLQSGIEFRHVSMLQGPDNVA